MYPHHGELMTCSDMLDFQNDLATAEWLAYSAMGLSMLLLLVPGANVIRVVKLASGALGIVGGVGSAVYAANKGAEKNSVKSVRGIVGCS